MSGFVGVIVSDPWLQSQFTQVELRTLKSKVSISVVFLVSKVVFEWLKLYLLFEEIMLINVKSW